MKQCYEPMWNAFLDAKMTEITSQHNNMSSVISFMSEKKRERRKGEESKARNRFMSKYTQNGRSF